MKNYWIKFVHNFAFDGGEVYINKIAVISRSYERGKSQFYVQACQGTGRLWAELVAQGYDVRLDYDLKKS